MLIVDGIKRHAEAVVLGVKENGMPVPSVRFAVDTEAVLEHDASFRRRAALQLLLAVIILESGRTVSTFLTEYKQLLSIGLNTLQAQSHHIKYYLLLATS